MTSLQSLDANLLLSINHGMANAVFDQLMPALSNRGFLLVLPFVAWMLLRGRKVKKDSGKTFLGTALAVIFIACGAIILALMTEVALKNVVCRVRPCRAVEGIRLIVSCPRDFSMPSGHAITSFACALPFFYLPRPFLSRSWRLYPLVLASLIAFSRLYLGVHYPTDVAVGAVLGAGIGMGLSLIYERGVVKTPITRK